MAISVNTVYNEEMVLIRSYTNSGNSKSVGLELNANLVASNKVKLFIGGSLYNYQIKGDIFGYQENNSSLNWSLKGNANFILSKQLKFTADFDIRSATVTAQGNNSMFYIANTAINYSPIKLENWNFSFKVLDVFTSNITGLDTRVFADEATQIFYQETVYTRTGLIAELGISYSFNNFSNSKKSRKTFGDGEF